MKSIIIAVLLSTAAYFYYDIGGEPDFIEPKLAGRNDIIFYGGFESSFNNPAWEKLWGIPWSNRVPEAELLKEDKAFIGKRSVRVKYPKGGVGPKEAGLQFPIQFQKIEKMKQQLFDSLYLRYYVKFEEGFDFRLGGKLPGLMGGNDSFMRSGGNQPDGTNGWTMRFMWRKNGEAVVYAYLPEGKYKEGVWGTDIKINKFFTPGKWHCIEQFIKINSPAKEDGKLYVWFDGELSLELNDVKYFTELNDAGRIGGIYFSTFHGGNTAEWGPNIASYAQFDGIAAGLNRIGLYEK